jgi:hypothetical protein
MKLMFKLGVLACTVFIATSSMAQSNPGYLGNTQVVEVSTNWYVPGLVANGPWVKNHTSISFEKSSSKNFSWRGGLRFGSGEFNGREHLNAFEVYHDGGLQTAKPVNGTLGYTLNEFFISPRWYNTNSGALAPFGSFFGLELAYAKIGIDDNISWDSRAFRPSVVTEGFSTLSMAIQWGHRRVLFDNVCWDYHMGIGFNVLNTGNASVAYFEDRTDRNDYEAVVHSMVLKPLAWGRIFHGGLGLSYLF